MADEHPAGRFEWERIIRRAILPGAQKLLAFVLGSYADPDGTRVRPGIDVLVAVTGTSEKTVRRHLTALRDLGLLTVVSRGGGRGGKGRATEYRLAIPADLLERVELLAPGERRAPERPNDVQPDQSLVDNSETPVTQVTAQSERSETNDRSPSDHESPIERSFQPIERSPRRPTTTHLTNHNGPDHVVTTRGESRPRATPERRRPPNPSDARPDELEAA